MLGVTIFLMSLTSPDAVMITVPGDITCLPSGYFWVIESESLPVGMLMPRAIANLLAASTAEYRRASSPLFLQGHIQLALREMESMPFSNGAKTMLVNASAIAILEPAAASINAIAGACPRAVAMPRVPV